MKLYQTLGWVLIWSNFVLCSEVAAISGVFTNPHPDNRLFRPYRISFWFTQLNYIFITQIQLNIKDLLNVKKLKQNLYKIIGRKPKWDNVLHAWRTVRFLWNNADKNLTNTDESVKIQTLIIESNIWTVKLRPTKTTTRIIDYVVNKKMFDFWVN